MAFPLEKSLEQGPIDPKSPALASVGSTIEAFRVYQTPDTMKMVLEDDDLKQVRREYGIPEGVVLEVPNLVNRVASCQENQIAIYEKVSRAGLRLPLPKVFADLLGWYRFCPAQLVLNAWRMIVEFFYCLLYQGLLYGRRCSRHSFK